MISSINEGSDIACVCACVMRWLRRINSDTISSLVKETKDYEIPHILQLHSTPHITRNICNKCTLTGMGNMRGNGAKGILYPL